MVRVVVVVGGGGGGGIRPLNDLVAKIRSNDLGRKSNSKNPDLRKKILCLTHPFPENPPKRFKLQISDQRIACPDRNFYKIENIRDPQFMLGRSSQIRILKSFRGQKGSKTQVA